MTYDEAGAASLFLGFYDEFQWSPWYDHGFKQKAVYQGIMHLYHFFF